VPKVSKPPSWPRSWASSSPFKLCSRVDAWASLHLLGQPNTFLAQALASHRYSISLVSVKFSMG
jgi:hypothetical protein